MPPASVATLVSLPDTLGEVQLPPFPSLPQPCCRRRIHPACPAALVLWVSEGSPANGLVGANPPPTTHKHTSCLFLASSAGRAYSSLSSQKSSLSNLSNSVFQSLFPAGDELRVTKLVSSCPLHRPRIEDPAPHFAMGGCLAPTVQCPPVGPKETPGLASCPRSSGTTQAYASPRQCSSWGPSSPCPLPNQGNEISIVCSSKQTQWHKRRLTR